MRTADGVIALCAEVDAASADAVIERLASFGIASNDLTLWRVPGIRPLGWHRRTRSEESDVQVWAEIVGRADENAKLASTYLVFMVSAGIIAGIACSRGRQCSWSGRWRSALTCSRSRRPRSAWWNVGGNSRSRRSASC